MNSKKYFLLVAIILFASFTSFNKIYAQWADLTTGNSFTISSVSSPSPNVAWFCADFGILWKTTDGGSTWQNHTGFTSIKLQNIYAFNSASALVTGTGNGNTIVWKTTNSGLNWNQVFIQPNGFINAIKFKDSQNGFMMGDPVNGRWSLWKTTNAGNSWDSAGIYLPSAASEVGLVNYLFYGSDGKVWFGPQGQNILYYSANLSAWTIQTLPAAGGYKPGLWFNNSGTGMVSVSGGIAKTTNEGLNWSISANLEANSITGYGNEWWYTSNTYIMHSTNNGSSWAIQFVTPVSNYDYSLMARSQIVDANVTIYSGKNDGNISKYSAPSAVRNISDRVPEKFSLSQNYPNPFNPVTNIKFSIVKSGFVNVNVYDILGKEVKELVNRSLTAGEYIVDFDASALESGIYFYTLKTGDFSETRKMMLVK